MDEGVTIVVPPNDSTGSQTLDSCEQDISRRNRKLRFGISYIMNNVMMIKFKSAKMIMQAHNPESELPSWICYKYSIANVSKVDSLIAV